MTNDDDETPAGSCASHPDPDMWFADSRDWERKAEAVRICSACPLLVPCREMAVREWPLLAGGLPLYAVVGGLTEKDIRRVRRGLDPVGVRPPGRPKGEGNATRANRPVGPCAACGRERPVEARGMCASCHSADCKRRRAAKAVC